MKHLYLFLCLFLLSGVAYAEQWLCITEKSTGFRYNETKKEWEAVNFKVDRLKYILTNNIEDYDGYILKNFYHDPKFSPNLVFCSNRDYVDKEGFLHCTVGGTLSFNKDNRRFVYASTKGYTTVDPNKDWALPKTDAESPTPFIEIGTCSLF